MSYYDFPFCFRIVMFLHLGLNVNFWSSSKIKATGIAPGSKKFNWTCSILKPFACICAKMTWTNHPGKQPCFNLTIYFLSIFKILLTIITSDRCNLTGFFCHPGLTTFFNNFERWDLTSFLGESARKTFTCFCRREAPRTF